MKLFSNMLALRQDADDERYWQGMFFPTTTNSSGERVTETTAMGVAAYFAAVRAISEDVAKLPLRVYRRDDKARRIQSAHPADRLLHVAGNPNMSAMAWRETMMCHALGWSNGYAEIVRDGGGRPSEIWPLDPTTVKPKMVGRELVYDVHVPPMPPVRLQARDVIHLHGMGYSGTSGFSLVQLAREAIGSVMAAQRHAAAYFGNGTATDTALSHPAALGQDAREYLTASFVDRHGGAGNHYTPLVLEEGMTVEHLGIDPEKSQLLETRQFGIEEVSRLFRIPPHKLQHLARATFSNIEHQSLEYLGDTIMPWLVRWEQEIALKLLDEPTLFARHTVQALLRADAKTRSDYYWRMFMMGAYSPNDILELEDRNPVDGGDARYIPRNLVEVGAPELAEDDSGDAAPVPEPGARVAELVTPHTDALGDVIGRALNVEADKLQRAAKHGNVVSWAESFYPGHVDHMEGLLAPVRSGITHALGAHDPARAVVYEHLVTSWARTVAQTHCAQSADDAVAGEEAAASWRNGRAAEEAAAAIEQLRDLVAQVASTERTDQ